MLQTELVIENVQVVKLEASIWTARKKLRPEDLILADGSKLPPDELASLGTMRIVDRDKLSAFETLKRRAESLCLKTGVRFLGGYAVPVGAMPALLPELDAIQAEFDGQKREFIASYADSVDEWMSKYPDFAPAIGRHVDPVESVAARLAFDYVVFGIAKPKAGAGWDGSASAGGSLDRSVASMGDSLFREVAVDANALLDNSLLGKQSVTRKALNPVRRMRDKLDGLSFLDRRVNPVVETIDALLAAIPKKGEIKGPVFDRVLSVALLLSDADKMRRHGEGLSAGRPQDAEPDLDLFGRRDAAPDDFEDGDEAGGEEEAGGQAGTVAVLEPMAGLPSDPEPPVAPQADTAADAIGALAGPDSASEEPADSAPEQPLAADSQPGAVAALSAPPDKAALFAEFDALLLDEADAPVQSDPGLADKAAAPAAPQDDDAAQAAESFVASLAGAVADAVPDPASGKALNDELQKLANAAMADGFFF
jgi:hypothetical protein